MDLNKAEQPEALEVESLTIRTSEGDFEYYGEDAKIAAKKVDNAIDHNLNFTEWIYADGEFTARRFNVADVKNVQLEYSPPGGEDDGI